MEVVPPPPRRAAPYASGRSLREFLQKIQGLGVPARVDREYLRRLQVARNNEWALLSALKFLGVLTPEGIPTTEYRLLQTTDRWRATLSGLVRTSYADLIGSGGLRMNLEELRNYFRLHSSASQAKNAARFFREIVEMSGLLRFQTIEGVPDAPKPQQTPANILELPAYARRQTDSGEIVAEQTGRPSDSEESTKGTPRSGNILEFDPLVRVRLSLIEKMPAARTDWTSEQYRHACEQFVAMCERVESLVKTLDGRR